MKTTLKARLLRLCTISVTLTGLILTLVAAIGSFNVSESDALRLSDFITSSCASSIASEFEYISGCLSEAKPSENGDNTFDRISLLSDNIYSLSNCESIISEMKDGDTALLPTALNADGETVILAAQKQGSNVIIGELSYDYLGAYLSGVSGSESETGFVIDKFGNVIVTANVEEAATDTNIGTDFGMSDLIKDINNNNDKGNLVLNSTLFDGNKSMINYTSVTDTDYYIVYAANNKTIFNSYYRLFNMLVIFSVLSIAVTVTFVFIVSTSIVKPVSSTTERLVKLSEGDLNSECNIKMRGDETQVLAEAMQKTILSLAMYIKDIDYVLSELSNGNLTVHSEVEYSGDFTGIKKSLDGISNKLRETMSAISKVGKNVLIGSDSISSGAQLLADNASNEASAIEEVNSMTIDIKSTVEKNSDNTESASGLMNGVMDNIENGRKTISDMADSMNDIKNTSDEIQKVVAIIEDIAFQTNILALNAAVEAARAGDAGKGFAVVADEVRNLAAKSADAAQETLKLVNRSSEAVNEGTLIADQTKQSFAVIYQSATDFAELMKDISAASVHQLQAINEINSGIENITNTIQSNSASAEESAAASQNLKELASVLNDEVSKFRV